MSSRFRDTPESAELLEQERLTVAATEAISEAMERRGINKRQLAAMLDVRPSEISQRLSGRRNLTLRSLAKMLHALGVRARLSIEDAAIPFVATNPWTSTSTAFQHFEFRPRTFRISHADIQLPEQWWTTNPHATSGQITASAPVSEERPRVATKFAIPFIRSLVTSGALRLTGRFHENPSRSNRHDDHRIYCCAGTAHARCVGL
jgi:transcriptional regulator with XRE-family HTH domain